MKSEIRKRQQTLIAVSILVILFSIASGMLLYNNFKLTLEKKALGEFMIFQAEQLAFLLDYTNTSYEEFNEAFLKNKVDQLLEEQEMNNLEERGE
jgi:hypothetical protein